MCANFKQPFSYTRDFENFTIKVDYVVTVQTKQDRQSVLFIAGCDASCVIDLQSQGSIYTDISASIKCRIYEESEQLSTIQNAVGLIKNTEKLEILQAECFKDGEFIEGNLKLNACFKEHGLIEGNRIALIEEKDEELQGCALNSVLCSREGSNFNKTNQALVSNGQLSQSSEIKTSQQCDDKQHPIKIDQGKEPQNCRKASLQKKTPRHKRKLNKDLERNIVECEYCNNFIQSGKELLEHADKPGNIYLCSNCNTSFQTKCQLNLHKSSCIVCKYCEKHFTSTADFNKHNNHNYQHEIQTEKSDFSVDYYRQAKLKDECGNCGADFLICNSMDGDKSQKSVLKDRNQLECCCVTDSNSCSKLENAQNESQIKNSVQINHANYKLSSQQYESRTNNCEKAANSSNYIECGSEFKTTSQEKCQSVQNNTHSCDLCSYEARTNCLVELHKNLEHLQQKKCTYCKSTYQEQDGNYHLKNDLLNCETCGAVYLTNCLLKIHSLYCHKCAKCKKLFKDTSQYKKHTGCIESKQNSIIKPKTPERSEETNVAIITETSRYVCEFCNKIFPTLAKLKQHVSNHLIEKKLMCTDCGKTFKLQNQLKVHLTTHSTSRPYTCTLCGKSFKTKSTQIMHTKTHSSKKPFQCDVCKKTFTTKSALKLHLQLHSSVKPHTCNVCGKGFFRKDHLAVHVQVHTGRPPRLVREFQCETCGKSFSTKPTLLVHMRIHTGEKPFGCGECGRRFTQRNALVYHERVHTGVKPFKCEVCGKSFGLKWQLVEHGRMHTGEKPFKCKVCDLAFSVRSNFYRHCKLHDEEI